MSKLHPIRVETHAGGHQTLHVARYCVDWQPFGGYYIVSDERGFVSKHSTQMGAVEAAESLAEKVSETMSADYIIRTYTEARSRANRARATMDASTGRQQGAAADEFEFWSSKSANMAAAAAKFGVDLPIIGEVQVAGAGFKYVS